MHSQQIATNPAAQLAPWRRHGPQQQQPATVRQVPTLRACALCMHTAGDQPGTDLVCRSPAARTAGSAGLACKDARSSTGPCGPNAVHLDMASWQIHRAQP